MKTASTIAELRRLLADARSGGRRVGLVPTMGALHAGHIALIDAARAQAPAVMATIFVNPLQFGPTEDFSRYPRAFDDDCARFAERGKADQVVHALQDRAVSRMRPAPASNCVRISAKSLRSISSERSCADSALSSNARSSGVM